MSGTGPGERRSAEQARDQGEPARRERRRNDLPMDEDEMPSLNLSDSFSNRAAIQRKSLYKVNTPTASMSSLNLHDPKEDRAAVQRKSKNKANTHKVWTPPSLPGPNEKGPAERSSSEQGKRGGSNRKKVMRDKQMPRKFTGTYSSDGQSISIPSSIAEDDEESK